jgi:hypothetical protein
MRALRDDALPRWREACATPSSIATRASSRACARATSRAMDHAAVDMRATRDATRATMTIEPSTAARWI